jgi:cob(I)alamin adenosyltransferase
LLLLAEQVSVPGLCLLSDVHVQQLTLDLEALGSNEVDLQTQVIPGGSTTSSFAHLAKAVCWRAERELHPWVSVEAGTHVSGAAPDSSWAAHGLVYVNRLSDLLELIAHRENSQKSEDSA